MNKAMAFSLFAVPALVVIPTCGALAQEATHAKPKPAMQSKPAGTALPKVGEVTVHNPVILIDNGDTWAMDNGIVRVVIIKKIGSLQQVIYHGIETLRPAISDGTDVYHTPQTPAGSQIPTWEQIPTRDITPSVTIDPATNGGMRAEVAVKGVSGQDGVLNGITARGRMDIEIRYTLERGASGFYAYAEFSHPAAYPAAYVEESQFDVQLNPNFAWFSLDADRNMLVPSGDDIRNGIVVHAKEQTIQKGDFYKNSVEHKYTYSGVMYRHPAWGFSSPKDHVGVYVINPSTEYIGGGAEKLDLNGPYAWHSNSTIQVYWTSGHYGGGSTTTVPAGQDWKKVIGPIFVYFNSIDHPKDPSQAELDKFTASYGSGTLAVPKEWHDNALALWNDALVKAKAVKAAWPFGWVEGMDYLHRSERGTVTGQLVLNDPQASSRNLPNLTVGLTHPNYTGPGTGTSHAKATAVSSLGRTTRSTTSSGPTARLMADSQSPMCYPAPTSFAPLPTGFWANTIGPRRSQWKRARRSISANSIGNPSATASRYGRSGTLIAPPTSSSRATAPITGYGVGDCVMQVCSPTTLPTPSARATTTRTGFSKRCHIQPPLCG